MPIERGGAAASRRIDAMQRRRLSAALALAAALVPLAPACAQVVEPRIHAPGPFDTLVVTGAGQVHLFQGERDEIVIPGERRLQDNVGVQHAGTTLTIALPRDPKLLGALAQVEVHVGHLTRLTLADASSVSAPMSFKSDLLAIRVTGTGQAQFDRLEVGQLAVDLAGAAEGRLAGKVDKLQLTAAGSSRFVADHLRARRIEMSVSGSAGADVWPVNEVELRVADSGRVRYWGLPRVKPVITGQGSIATMGAR